MKFPNMKIVSCFILMTLGTVQCYTLDDITRLKKKLLTDYDKGLRPIYNQLNAIEVKVRFYIQNIIQFDMNNGQLGIMGYMITSWRDEKMAWYGSEFDGIDSISLDGGDLWHPVVSQLNAMTEMVKLDSIMLLKDGTVIRAEIRKYNTFCDLNMRKYPNDKHDCKFEFLSLKYPTGQVTLIPEFDRIGENFLTKHDEWQISSSSVKSRVEVIVDNDVVKAETIIFELVLERQPAFNVIHQSVPLLIIATSVLFIHLIPLKFGERIPYAVTLQLSLIFWQALIADELPKNSSQISIFSMIITLILFSTGIVTVSSVILCRIALRGTDREIPLLLLMLTKRFYRNSNTRANLHGNSDNRANLHGNSDNRANLHGNSDNRSNLHGNSDNRANLHGNTDNRSDVYGIPDNLSDLHGNTDNRSDVYGNPYNRSDVYGNPDNRSDVYGNTDNRSDVYGNPDNRSDVYGNTDNRSDVYGNPDNRSDVYGNPDNRSNYLHGNSNNPLTNNGNIDNRSNFNTNTIDNRSICDGRTENRTNFHLRIERQPYTWIEAADAVDKLLLYFNLTVIIVPFAIYGAILALS